MKDVIFTTTINYDYDKIRLFLNSLNTCYNGEVVIFSNLKYKLHNPNFKLTVININDDWVKKSCGLKLNGVINLRHFWYLNFLNRFSYNRVLLSDSRDVFVQSNPFEKISDDCLHVAIEDSTIANCPFNSKWIKAVYGEDYFKKISNTHIVCAGTTMGNSSVIKNYLSFMCSEIERFSYLDIGENSNILIDQSIHNYYCNEFPDKIRKNDNSGNVFLTLGYAQIINLSRQGLLVNNLQEVYSLVHQFDRINWLNNHLKQVCNNTIKKNKSFLLFK